MLGGRLTMYKLMMRRWSCFGMPEDKIEVYLTEKEAEKEGKKFVNKNGGEYFIEEIKDIKNV